MPILLMLSFSQLSNSSLEDLFGDEQTFPFVAGFGK